MFGQKHSNEIAERGVASTHEDTVEIMNIGKGVARALARTALRVCPETL